MAQPNSTFQPPGWPEVVVPNDAVVQTANQFRDAAVLLFNNMKSPNGLYTVPFYTLCGFTIELYLKSLNSRWIFEVDPAFTGDPASVDESTPVPLIVTASPVTWGHRYEPILAGIQSDVKNELENAYQTNAVVSSASTLSDALDIIEGVFPRHRYTFENTDQLPNISIFDLIALVNFFGQFVATVRKRPVTWYPT